MSDDLIDSVVGREFAAGYVKPDREQYEICLQRGHKARDFRLGDWDVCIYCGVEWRYERVERNPFAPGESP